MKSKQDRYKFQVLLAIILIAMLIIGLMLGFAIGSNAQNKSNQDNYNPNSFGYEFFLNDVQRNCGSTHLFQFYGSSDWYVGEIDEARDNIDKTIYYKHIIRLEDCLYQNKLNDNYWINPSKTGYKKGYIIK